jgi:hypothetical protein
MPLSNPFHSITPFTKMKKGILVSTLGAIDLSTGNYSTILYLANLAWEGVEGVTQHEWKG